MMTGLLQLFDAESLELLTEVRDRRAAVTDLRFSPDGLTLASCYEGAVVDFYRLSEKGKRLVLAKSGFAMPKGASSVMHLDFSTDGSKIQADVCDASGKGARICFTVPGGDIIPDEGTEWSSWTSITGKDALGIWPRDAKSTDVNCKIFPP